MYGMPFIYSAKFIYISYIHYEIYSTYGKPLYFLLCKINIIYVVSDSLYRILDI